MSTKTKQEDQDKPVGKSMPFFERYLTIWVLLCIGAGIGLGYFLKGDIEMISNLTIGQVNIPVAILIWFMIYPMMVQIDFSSLTNFKGHGKGLLLTVTANWIIKPFTMAFFAWIFFSNIFQAFLSPEQAAEYTAGAILLGAAPCTAMVFVWSYLSDGNPNFTLIQVSINDIILLVAYIPIVKLLLGITNIDIPTNTLVTSVVMFVVVPLVVGYISNRLLIRMKGEAWFKSHFLPALKPVSVFALLTTLILLFAFQGEIIVNNPFIILLIAIPLALQTYFIFFITWGGGKLLKVPYAVCAPASMIGASNFFELAVAVAIALFGLQSGAALATVVGVLIEVPIMLSLVQLARRWRY